LETVQRKIYYYEKVDGSCPFIKWHDSCKDKLFLEAWQNRLLRIRLGLMGKCNSVGEGVTELKFDIGPGYRVYFGEWGRAVVVILYGGDKSMQSRRDIKLAKQYWSDFRRSNA
jgi:putative addiction module killer protein